MIISVTVDNSRTTWKVWLIKWLKMFRSRTRMKKSCLDSKGWRTWTWTGQDLVTGAHLILTQHHHHSPTDWSALIALMVRTRKKHNLLHNFVIKISKCEHLSSSSTPNLLSLFSPFVVVDFGRMLDITLSLFWGVWNWGRDTDRLYSYCPPTLSTVEGGIFFAASIPIPYVCQYVCPCLASRCELEWFPLALPYFGAQFPNLGSPLLTAMGHKKQGKER